MKKVLKVGAWIFVALLAFLTVQVIRAGKSTPQVPEVSYSEFLKRVAAGRVSKVTITCNLVRAYDAKDGGFEVTSPSNQTAMLELLQQHGVEVWFRDAPTWLNWVLYLILLVPLVAVWPLVIGQRRRIKQLEASHRTGSS